MDKRHYKSQYGQDRIIEKLCYPKGGETHKGVFIEVGSWDGVDISNTYYLEKMRDWTGVIVEPIKTQAESSMHNRWCKTFYGVVYDKNGIERFHHIKGYSEMLSGVEGGYHPDYQRRVSKEISDHNQQTEVVNLECKTINGLMDSYGLTNADYLSLDTQTSELKVLRSYDSKKNPVKCIGFDGNGINKSELHTWFTENGYKLVWKHDTADEYLYIRDDIDWTWNNKE